MKDLIVKFFGGGALIAVILLAVGMIIAFPLSWAWNYVIPELFGLQRIGAMQAFCLYFVSSTLFKSTQTKSK